MLYNNLRPLSSALSLQPSGPGEESCSSDGGTTSDGLQWLWSQTLRREEKEGGKRLPAWQPPKQQGLPHMMETLHGLVSSSDWRAEIHTGPSERPSCLGLRAAQQHFKGELLFLIGGDSRAYEKMLGTRCPPGG